MIARVRHIVFAIVLLIGCREASAQYYSWGADPESMGWRKIKGNKMSVIYPDTAARIGSKLFRYVEAVQPTIDFGFRHGPMNIPFVIHPENAKSNGLVMWLPKRVEILSSPAINGYSMPWLKQLAAHEYRHAVQYNNLNKGFVRVFSYLLGQQSSTIGLLFMPLWALEGDAVLAETQMSSFGRALQPSFTMAYRAEIDDLVSCRNNDKWFCGSYRQHIPDHYQLGYQLVSYANTKYNQNVWDKVIRYAVRNPYVFATTYVGLNKYYNTSTNQIFRETFDDLARYWKSASEEHDSATPIQTQKPKFYATYRYPMPLDERHILAVRESLDRTAELVKIEQETGNEERLCYIGELSSRPTILGKRIYWSEYRRGVIYRQRVNSRLCYVDIDRGLTRTVPRYRNVQFPTAIEKEDSLAWVEYRPNGTYAIMKGLHKGGRELIEMPDSIELHGLAYDNKTEKLYFIATSDSGMWLGAYDDKQQAFEQLTDGAYITLSDLSARDGVLYFGSIASGKDEAHCFDIAERCQRRITTSRYGTFSPTATANGEVLVTTYSKSGYAVASQPLDKEQMVEVKPSRLPVNRLNPPRKMWQTINLDTVRFTTSDQQHITKEHRPRRFSKLLHMFNVHSWAPASYDPFDLSEGMFNFNLGATVMSQSLLSNAEGFFTWAWSHDEGHFIKAKLRYYGLGVNIGIGASYGGTQQMYTAYTYEKDKHGDYKLVFPDEPIKDKYYNVEASLSLPLYLSSGHYTRYLAVSTLWNYSNGLVAKVDNIKFSYGNASNIAKIGFEEGIHLLQAGVAYQCTERLAHRDFAPRYGYGISFNYAINPANRDFGRLAAVYAHCYLPGIVRPHSLRLKALYQTSMGGFKSPLLATNMSFKSSQLIPHGFKLADINNDNYVALSAAYQLPLCYPDGGITSILYFKRIRLNVGFDYASFTEHYFAVSSANGDKTAPIRAYKQISAKYGSQVVALQHRRQHLYSYGADVTFDVNLFGMPQAATTSITLSVYRPVGKRGVYVSAGVGLPF